MASQASCNVLGRAYMNDYVHNVYISKRQHESNTFRCISFIERQTVYFINNLLGMTCIFYKHLIEGFFQLGIRDNLFCCFKNIPIKIVSHRIVT